MFILEAFHLSSQFFVLISPLKLVIYIHDDANHRTEQPQSIVIRNTVHIADVRSVPNMTPFLRHGMSNDYFLIIRAFDSWAENERPHKKARSKMTDVIFFSLTTGRVVSVSPKSEGT